mmetsp:Transcript_2078/g.2967  ORF Transcript_2078/g.2967 Transcript_2078/m.2967 type:complete len:391 (-) Transcript_2078:1627-2799(-)|eukprot:CAMPEP_0178915618 /NCGR_PEP_ID=MMETSP0786-20121207/12125_1 /TAXON_ID=186022 /ORGANISM="Thalassionema frauenfeldii, Strain CCMP 1798" /LENGTH=390 /DNA_ID=CAMNT_0020588745 /DNA_START=124 /DNA_END=1296 /DNA_ORIENTATION=-
MSYVPYQIDYQIKGAGKTLGITKKRVTWKFGFANDEALGQGFSGSQCRGSEHEVNFVWSLASGKRQIVVDGKEAHFSETGMNGWTSDRTFQHHFNLYSPNYGTIRCHLITLPPNHDAPGGNRPFQLKVNGVNFFDFCQVFQLGTAAMIVRPASSKRSGRSGDDVNISPEERQAIARAKLESMKDVRKDAPRDVMAPATKAQDSLISFDDPVPQQGVQASQNTQFMSSVTLDPSFGSPTSDNQPYNSSQTKPAPYANYPLPPAPAPVAPAYSNYTLPPAPAAPQFQQYQQTQSGQPQYSQPPLPPTNAVPPQYPSAPVTGVSQSQSNNGYPPTAPTWNSAASPAPSQQLVVNTSAPSNQAYAGSTPHSQASYGSAPSFAQPPRQQSGQYGF